MGRGSRGRAETQETQQGSQLPLDGGGRLFQDGLDTPPEEKNGTPDGQGLRDVIPIQQEIPSKTTDGRWEGILQ